MLLLSTKTNNKIVLTDERTDGRAVCKIVFSITFNVRIEHFLPSDTAGWQFLKRESPQTVSLCSAF